jgi:phage replication O-like protein O
MNESVRALRKGYTRVPNWLIELMPELPQPVLRLALAILRESVGWGAKSVTLSLTDLVALTGLHRSSVLVGINQGLTLKIIERKRRGQSYAYRLKHPEDQSVFPAQTSRRIRPVRRSNRSGNPTSASRKVRPVKEDKLCCGKTVTIA